MTQKASKDSQTVAAAFAQDVREGLSSNPKFLYSRDIYDDEGSRLFEEIMKLEEYYLTGAEKEVLEQFKSEYAYLLGDLPVNLVELGAGNGEKTGILLEYLLSRKLPITYRPLDISSWAIDRLEEILESRFPELEMEGMVGDYFEGLEWLKANSNQKNLVLFLGSNIGNFTPKERSKFLSKLHQSLNPGDLVAIGFDLKKEIEIMNKAYNDAQGVTEAFNMNLLHRINKELDGHFDPECFRFYAGYNPKSGAVESFLLSTREQVVPIDALDMKVSFDEWEPIHTESSYKFTLNEIHQMAEENGFTSVTVFPDSRHYYINAIWRV